MIRKIKQDGVFVRLGGNAIVLEDAPILPYQAYVDFIGIAANNSGYIAAGGYYTSLSLSDMGITHWQADHYPYGPYNFGVGYIGLAVVGGSLANNSIPTVDIDLQLYTMVPHYSIYAGTATDLAGGQNGVPTPGQLRIDGGGRLQCASYPNDSEVLIIDGATNIEIYVVTFDATVDFASSGFQGTNYVVGIQDSPTLLQINAYVALLVGTVDGFFEMGHDADLPLTNRSTPGLLTDFIEGQPFFKNADITTINTYGGSITVNEYLNRKGPVVDVSGAGLVECNGTCQRAWGLSNTKYTYTLDGLSSFPYIGWNGTAWVIVGSDTVVKYISTTDTAEPWEAIFTSVDPANDPAPTLSLVSGTDTVEAVSYTP